jgi:hypothetical protein
MRIAVIGCTVAVSIPSVRTPHSPSACAKVVLEVDCAGISLSHIGPDGVLKVALHFRVSAPV